MRGDIAAVFTNEKLLTVAFACACLQCVCNRKRVSVCITFLRVSRKIPLLTCISSLKLMLQFLEIMHGFLDKWKWVQKMLCEYRELLARDIGWVKLTGTRQILLLEWLSLTCGFGGDGVHLVALFKGLHSLQVRISIRITMGAR